MNSERCNEHNAFRQDKTDPQYPSLNLYQGQYLHGFEVKAVTPIDELQAVAIELRHQRSGARLLHFYTADTENRFSISFPTPTPDDTGVQHILEHSVLSGSHTYPLKDVFGEMLKISTATTDGTNAQNWIDHVYYYTSSNIKKDLFNLAEVFFDSVFYPLLTEETFKREGHHLEPANPDDPTGDLKVNGIVYNEVKAGFSDPRALMYLAANCQLMSDTLYSYNAAGGPESIPELTYAQFKDYYQIYYHPSNSYFFLYGNIPTSDYLVFLSDKLAAFPKTETSTTPHPLPPEITHPPKWKSPRIVKDTYPIGADEPLTEKTYLLLGWLIGDASDVEDMALCKVLSLILLGNEGAPLRKAIVDSKLGTDLFDDGFLMRPGTNTIGPHSTFYIGLTGSEGTRIAAFTELVINTLAQIADAEIDKEQVESALQQVTYDYQEVTPMFPHRIMHRVIGQWIYEKDPTSFLKIGTCLSAIRQRWGQNPRIFNELIHERLLKNPHRLTTILSPDPSMQARLDTASDQRMKAVRTQLNDNQVQKIVADAAELERLNEQPDPPELLAKLPQLRVVDLPTKPQHIPTTIENVGGQNLLRNDVFSNGINYVVLNFDLTGLPQHLWQYLPRYADAIHKLGTNRMNYEQIAQRTAAATGGLECTPNFSTHALDPNRSLWNMQFRIKSLDGKMADALEVLHDLIFTVNPRHKERLRDVLEQAVTEYRTSMVHTEQHFCGSTTAIHHAARGLSPHAHLSEVVFGLPQLRTSETLLKRFDESYEELTDYIEQIRDFLLVRDRVTASFTGSDAAFRTLQGTLTEWIGSMRDEPITPTPTGFNPFDTPPREGLAAPMQAAHCTQVTSAPHYSHPDSALLTIGAHILWHDYMLTEIRLKGNAYLGGFFYDPLDACFYQGSYADPHIARTLNVFEKTADYVKQTEWTQTDIDRAIIATAADYQKTVRSGQAATDTLTHHLTGQTQEMIDERYAQLRSATPKEVKRALLQTLEENQDKASICVVASREKLEDENQKMSRSLSIENILE